jgi:exonuclease VII small subunit
VPSDRDYREGVALKPLCRENLQQVQSEVGNRIIYHDQGASKGRQREEGFALVYSIDLNS